MLYEVITVAHGAEGVGAVAVDGDRGAGACVVSDACVGAVVGVGPEVLAGLGVEAVDALLLVGFDEAVGDEDSAVGDGGAAVAAGDFGAPENGSYNFV